MDKYFDILADNFPYKEKVELCKEDASKLVQALLRQITFDIEKNYIAYYNNRAIDIIYFINIDYGASLAKEYYMSLIKISGVKLNESFYGNEKVKSSLKEINFSNSN